jgi:hypothetical protein
MEPPQQSTLFNTLVAFLHALPSPHPLYCLIGGLATGAWGTVRATQDVDFLMLLDHETRDHVLSILDSRDFKRDARWAEVNPMLKGIVTRLRHGPYPVDLLQPRDRHEEETLARRRLVQIEKTSIWVASPEDLILLKIKAGRDLDFIDAKTIIARRGETLDVEYLWSWADRLSLQGELTYVLKTAAEPI